MAELPATKKLNRYQRIMERIFFWHYIEDDSIALFEFEESEQDVVITSEKHYRLVPSDNLTGADLSNYKARTAQ